MDGYSQKMSARPASCPTGLTTPGYRYVPARWSGREKRPNDSCQHALVPATLEPFQNPFRHFLPKNAVAFFGQVDAVRRV